MAKRRPRASVWRDTIAAGRELSATEVLLLTVLSSYGCFNRWWTLGHDSLVRDTHLSRRAVINAIASCERKRWLEVDRAKPGETQRANRYRVTPTSAALAAVEEQAKARAARRRTSFALPEEPERLL